MSALSHISKVVPEHLVNTSTMLEVGKRWLGDDAEAQEKFMRISTMSGVQDRRFIMPYDAILSQNGLAKRAEYFESFGTCFLSELIENSLSVNDQDPNEVGALVFTSCSMPIIPSIDAAAILKSRLPRDILRVPIYQHGCAGGVVGLSLGAKLCALGKPVMVASVELCSLVFQPRNHSGSHLVGASIFADGGAATILAPDKGKLKLKGSSSCLLPESRHLMGYDIFDDGFHLRLDRSLPSALIDNVPSILGSFLQKHGNSTKDIKYWLFHPGGIKILDFLRSTLSLSKEQCCWSYDVLREHGNLSSSTIFYVLDAFLNDQVIKAGELVLMMGIGPGLTVELILFEG